MYLKWLGLFNLTAAALARGQNDWKQIIWYSVVKNYLPPS